MFTWSMFKKMAAQIATATSLCCASTYASADPGAYVGASYGQTQISVNALDFSESDSGYKVFVGYTFNPYAALELNYVDAGQPTEVRGRNTIEVSATGVVASAIAKYPFGKLFAATGKLGFAFYDTDTTSDIGIAYGLGISVAIWESFEARVEYEQVTVDDGDFSMMSIGAVYKF
jgi:OmpA-OmpF porin, OOP family